MTYFQAEVSLGLGGSPSDKKYWPPSHFIYLFIYLFIHLFICSFYVMEERV